MRQIALLATAILAFLAAPVSASLTITGGAGLVNLPINGNDFNSHLDDFVDQLYSGGADVQVTAAGTLQFYLHASESGFTDQLVRGIWNSGTDFAGGTVLGQENENSWSDAGVAIGSPIAVIAGDTFSSLGIGFNVLGTPGGALDARAGTAGFGVFRVSGQGNTGYTQIFIGFDDNGAGPDDNHDDMIVSAVFTAVATPSAVVVPEPLSVAIWSGLAVVFGVSQFISKRRRGSSR